MIRAVRELGADIGIALDGDADRAILCDEKGELIDGDQIIARIGKDQLDTGQLTGDGVVTTVMSNFGLERYLQSENLRLVRTKVAIAMWSRPCAVAATMSAANNPGTSCCLITPQRATA